MKRSTILTTAKEGRNGEAEGDGGYAIKDQENPYEERIAVGQDGRQVSRSVFGGHKFRLEEEGHDGGYQQDDDEGMKEPPQPHQPSIQPHQADQLLWAKNIMEIYQITYGEINNLTSYKYACDANKLKKITLLHVYTIVYT